MSARAAHGAGWAAAAGAVAWLAFVLHDLAEGPWRDPLHSHGPVIVLMALVLAAQRWRAHRVQPRDVRPKPRGPGMALCGLSVVLATLGRWGDAPLLQGAALAPMLAGAALLCGGMPLLRALAFPVGFLLFAIPMPSALADALTQPMKHGVSLAAAAVLDALGHVVWLDGVVLGIGPYRLLVADACAGLHSLLMLEAFGLLYLHLVRHPSAARTAVLALAIVPISLAANVVRVVLLALVTVHFGDAAGQGVVHGASGLILFVAALAMIWPLDQLLRRVTRTSASPAPPVDSAAPEHTPPSRHASITLATLLFAGTLALAAGPFAATPAPGLAPMTAWLPQQVGGWLALPAQATAQVAAATDGAEVYDDQAARSYRHADGRTVMLTLAHARAQTRAARIHAPPVCYAAAGFRVQSGGRTVLAAGDAPITAETMLTRRDGRHEAVLWWVRQGERQDTPGAVASAFDLFVQRLRGEMPDGMLVRASTIVASDAAADAETTYATPRAFLTDLMQALPPEHRRLLAR